MGETDEGGRTGQRRGELPQVLRSMKGAKVPTITLLPLLCSGLLWVTEVSTPLLLGGRTPILLPPALQPGATLAGFAAHLGSSRLQLPLRRSRLASQPARSPPAWQGAGEGVFLRHPVLLRFPWGKGRSKRAGVEEGGPDPHAPRYLMASCTVEKLTQVFPSNTGGPTSTRRPRSTKSSAFSRAVPPGIPRLGRRMAWTACPPWGSPRTSTSSPPETSQATPFLRGAKFLPLDFSPPILVPLA